MSTKDQLLYSALHGIAMRYAADAAASINPSRSCARSPMAATTSWPRPRALPAGYWYASPATNVGHELIGAGMLILAGGGQGFPLDYDELERWTRVGYERGMRSRKGER
jgi:hypothetical protein